MLVPLTMLSVLITASWNCVTSLLMLVLSGSWSMQFLKESEISVITLVSESVDIDCTTRQTCWP